MAIIDKPSDYFNTVLHTGTGSEQTVSGVGFQPDFTWIKSRSNGTPHVAQDSVRGATKQLIINTSDTETSYTQYLKSFNSDGFVLGTDSFVNANSQNYVSWNWKAGTSFTNDASGTGIGSIDSSGSVNTDAGFSIVSWTGTGSAGTIAHGLNKLPKMIIAKQRNSTANWVVYFLDTSIAYNNVNNYLELNTTIASTGDSGARWGAYANYSTTTFGVGTNAATNANGSTYIAYVFSDIQGYSKIGKYTGNGSADGPFVHTGFKTKYLMLKLVDNAQENWSVYDTARNPINGPNDHILFPDNVSSENSNTDDLDMLSNGFRLIRSHARANSSGYNYFYYAFAENPFVTSTGVPATAR